MARIYIHFQGLEQQNDRMEEEIQHIRRFLHLVETCREIDTMHQKELRDICSRLEEMERNLRQIMDVTEMMMRKYRKINRETLDQLNGMQSRSSHLFE